LSPKESYAVLKSNPGLTLFPVLSAIATVLVSIPFLILLVPIAIASKGHHHAFEPLHYLVMFGMYFASYFVVVFFNSALVACANESLSGEPVTVAFGFEAAMRRLPQILA